MQGELSFLIELQKFDAAIDDLREKADAVTPIIQKKNQQLETLRSDLKNSKDALSQHTLKKKQLEADAEAQEKLVQKHNSELNSLKSNDAYKAMLGEIQAAKDAVVKIEDEILSVMEIIEADNRKYKELETKFKSDEAAVKAEIQQLESQKNAILSDVKKKEEERAAYAATVPPVLLGQYEAIREKRGSLAIVPMVNNSCGGCHMGLTQAKMNEIRKAKTMMVCDSCSRILYLPQEAPASPAVSAN
jgi:predicted  nucleic acid-binding Zn-ribbon protein